MAKTPEYTKRAINKYREKFDFFQVKLPKGTKEKIEKDHNRAIDYINRVLLDALKKDGYL